MKFKYIYTILVCLLTTSIQSQTIETLMQNFNNDFVLTHAEMYEKQKEFVKPEGIEGVDYILIDGGPSMSEFPDHVRIVNMDSSWLSTMTNLITNDPSLIETYLNSNNHDFSSFLLLLHIFEVELITSAERVTVKMILRDVLDDEGITYLRNMPNSKIKTKEDLFNFFWQEEKVPHINRIIDVVNSQYSSDKHIVYSPSSS